MRGLEGPRAPGEQFIFLTTPDVLSVGQNFYDQPPFQTALAEASLQTQTDLGKLRSVFSHAAMGLRRLEVESESPEKRLADPAKASIARVRSEDNLVSREGVRHLLSRFYFGSEVNSKDRESYKEAVRLAIRALVEYLSWEEYVSTQVGSGRDYRNDGTPNPQVKRPMPATSYAKWIYNRQRAEESAWLWGLADVLPSG